MSHFGGYKCAIMLTATLRVRGTCCVDIHTQHLVKNGQQPLCGRRERGLPQQQGKRLCKGREVPWSWTAFRFTSRPTKWYRWHMLQFCF